MTNVALFKRVAHATLERYEQLHNTGAGGNGFMDGRHGEDFWAGKKANTAG